MYVYAQASSNISHLRYRPMLPTCMAPSPIACDRARHAYRLCSWQNPRHPHGGQVTSVGRPHTLCCSCTAHASLMLLYPLVLPDSWHINGARWCRRSVFALHRPTSSTFAGLCWIHGITSGNTHAGLALPMAFPTAPALELGRIYTRWRPSSSKPGPAGRSSGLSQVPSKSTRVADRVPGP
ncbi:hypothetical protein BGZ61DRAFT_443205 [Ilyonectria robusta]|uniref:uncharacterized protein n=1 Tax=Ilyonectria robusta TaxID=1079257 RepID=UPI001E8E0BAD|nr:uncharacterized protein BGZ61DRAFT_443205 [Ilyonectria robusta]KAH8734831.1 hypothetical protein BGZ61DRAFT_443205 [Ilyonectria robusta]